MLALLARVWVDAGRCGWGEGRGGATLSYPGDVRQEGGKRGEGGYVYRVDDPGMRTVIVTDSIRGG